MGVPGAAELLVIGAILMVIVGLPLTIIAVLLLVSRTRKRNHKDYEPRN